MMTTDSISVKDRLAELRRLVHEHNHRYFVLNEPIIPDETFDKIFRELLELEKAHPEFADPNSPTVRVGNDSANEFVKVQHEEPMLSLAKVFSVEETVGFFVSAVGGPDEDGFEDLAQQELAVEPKIDGLSLSLHYENGQLVRAVTRGDGTTGDDVTANARTIQSIPLQAQHNALIGDVSTMSFEVRGEAYMTKDTFAALNAERAENGEQLFANPRNAAAGTLKQKDSREVAKRQLRFIAYQAYGLPVETHVALLGMLGMLGFHTPTPVMCRPDPDEVEHTIDEFTKCRANYPYDIDGLVFKLNRIELQVELGAGTTTPKWAVAYKFPAERKLAKLLDIELTVGRTGQITPNARIEPTQIAGTTVKNASLSNIDIITRRKIDVGDTIILQKAGEIIPEVVGVQFSGWAFIDGRVDLEASGAAKDAPFPEVSQHSFDVAKTSWKMPTKCPACNSDLVRDGVHYFCVNDHCLERKVQYLIYALGKGCLDWDGMGEAAVRDLVEHGTDYASLLSILKMSNDDIEHIFKPAMQRKFKAERERIKAAPLWRKLKALGIAGLGTTNAKAVAHRWGNLADALDHIEEVPKVIGQVNGKAFTDYVIKNVDYLADLQSAGFVFAEERHEGPLSGKLFCITGAMASGTRDQVAARIEKAGGVVKSSVGKKVNFLVSGPGGGQNKADDAKKYGTKVITEEELYAMIGQAMPTARGSGNANQFEFEGV
jgi:DNA ligase (NAD+)